MKPTSPRIISGVPGPAGEPGVLLLVPPSEALDWDLKEEVASTSRHWMADRQAWWVAAPYAATAAAIVLRIHGPASPLEALGRPDATGWQLVRRRAVRALLRALRRAGGGLRALRRRPPVPAVPPGPEASGS